MRWVKTCLVTLLAGALVAYILVERKREGEQQEVEQRLLRLYDDLKLEDITGAALVTETETMIFSKVSDDYWQTLQPVRADGDKNTIETALRAVVDLQRDRVLGASPGDLAQFGLAPAKLRVSLTDRKRGERDTLLIGDRNPTESLAYAKFASDPEVFTVKASLLYSIEKSSFDFRDKRVLTFEQDEVRKVEIRRKSDTVVLTRRDTGWDMQQPAQVKADATEVERLLNKVRFARATEFAAETSDSLARWGLEEPEIELTLWLGTDMARKRLLVGKREGEEVYAHDDSRPPVFLVRSDIRNELAKDVFAFRDRSLASFEREAVDRIELVRADATIVCQRDTTAGPDGWTIVAPQRRPAKGWKVSNILTQLKNLKAEQFVSGGKARLATYGLITPRARAKLYSGDKLLVNVALGAAVGATDSLYAISTQVADVAIVRSGILDDLQVGVDDLAGEASTAGTSS